MKPRKKTAEETVMTKPAKMPPPDPANPPELPIDPPPADAALLALVNEFERAVLPEFERRCREIRRRNADAAGEEVADVAAWDQVTTWLGTFLDSIAEHRATTFEGLRAKARAGLAVAPDAHHDDAMDNIDETIVASIIRDLLSGG